MFFTIFDMNGNQIQLKRPQGMQFGLVMFIKLNDGSDPTEIELMFDTEQSGVLERAIGFFN